MENTEELEIDIEDIGTILKSNRLKQKKSLEDVSSDLCIRKIYLTALEEGDYETLTPIPYGIGYVRTYANYLGLSSERAVKLYKAAVLVEEQNKIGEEEVVPEINKSNNKHVLFGFLALIAVYGLWVLVSSLSTPNNAETINKEVATEEVVVVDEVSEEKSEGSETDVNSKSDAVEEASDTIQNEITENIKEEKNETIEVKETSKDNDDILLEKNKVVVKFNGESWVELKDKKKVYFQGVYHLGDMKKIDYTENLFISVGRPKNVEVYVNGEKKNLLAKRRKTNILIDSLE